MALGVVVYLRSWRVHGPLKDMLQLLGCNPLSFCDRPGQFSEIQYNTVNFTAPILLSIGFETKLNNTKRKRLFNTLKQF